MKLKVLKCPECRANLEIEDDRTSCYCQYCGCKIILDSEKQEYTYNKNVNVSRHKSGYLISLKLHLFGFFSCYEYPPNNHP